MNRHPHGPFRIYSDPTPDTDVTGPDPHTLAARELLRPISARAARRDLEPFSRSWFEELEIKRYAPHGGGLWRVLEFTRHGGESMLMLGAGVGLDALQYHRHGADVTICATPTDSPDVVRKNFEARGLTVKIVHTAEVSASGPAIPFDKWTFDLAYLNAIHDPPADPQAVVDELYRVLKPGGKAFALFPAWYDTGLIQDVLLPFRKWYRSPAVAARRPTVLGPRAEGDVRLVFRVPDRQTAIASFGVALPVAVSAANRPRTDHGPGDRPAGVQAGRGRPRSPPSRRRGVRTYRHTSPGTIVPGLPIRSASTPSTILPSRGIEA